MQILIDIDEDVYKKIVADKYAIYDKMFYSIKNGTPIPDNATNGDVLKTMFMPNRITRMDDIVCEEYDFTHEWWNTPYKTKAK